MEKYNISKLNFLFILIILLMFIGSMNPLFTFLSLFFSAMVAFVIATQKIENNLNVCIGIVWLLCFQNLCVGLGAHLCGNVSDSLKYVTQIPFLVLSIIWAFIQVRKLKSGKFLLSKINKSFVLYVLCIFFSFFIQVGDLKAILINMRNMLTFFFAYEIGTYYIDDENKLSDFYCKFMKILKLVFALGIVLMIGGYTLYRVIGIREVYIAKGAQISASLDALPGRFYTKIFYTLLPRMGSIYYEPINLAYFFAFGLLMSLFFQNKKKITNVLISGVGLILTVGKGGFFIVGLSVVMLYLSKILKILFSKISSKIINNCTIVIVVLLLAFFVNVYTRMFPSSSVMPHIWGIQRTWKVVLNQPYGHGIATGGNMSHLFGAGSVGLSSGEESAIMSYLYQIGIQGVFCLFLCFKNLFSKSDLKDNKIQICYFLPYVIFITSLFQENTFSPQCIIVYMFLLGAMRIIVDKNDKKIEGSQFKLVKKL